MCECGRADCREEIELDLEDYERLRDDRSQFVVKPGHEFPDVEHIVLRLDGCFVIEKIGEGADRVQ